MTKAIRTILAALALTVGLAASVQSASATPRASHAESAAGNTGGPSGGVYVE